MKETIKETRLKNGLTILSDRMEGSLSATLGFFLRRGARDEPDELNGITHFIEHCVFKGTAKRSALDIAIEQDRLGGNFDAYTSHEETCFAVKVIDERLPEAFDLIGDMLTKPRFDERDLKSERRVILEEIKMTADSAEDDLGDVFSAAFFAGHPLGLSIAGTRKTVRKFGTNEARAFHERLLRPDEVVIAAAGNVDHRQLVKMSQRLFNGNGSRPKHKLRRAGRPKPLAPIVIKQKKDLEQSHMILAAPFPAGTSRERYAADLLANIIGGGTSSRLWQSVREERGLAYSIGASFIAYSDCGLFSVFGATSPEQCGEVLDLCVAELRRIVKEGVSAEELTLAKDQAKAAIYLGLEDSAARAAALAQSEMLHGRQIFLDETLANINAVTEKDTQKLAKKYLRTEKMAFAAIGDLRKLKVTRERLKVS
jgi:predicted Zn-dependent peptidase